MRFSTQGPGGRMSRYVRHPLFLVALVALPFFLIDLGAPALNDGEAMYAQIAREMRAGGDWVTPHLNGNRHFDKPPLIYWMIGIAQAVMGETEASARLWPALAAWGTIPLVGALGSTLYGTGAGLIAALVFATSLGPYIFGRMVMPDPILVFWITLAIFAYAKSYLRESENSGRWNLVMYAGLGMATLTKSILGLGLPGAIIGLHVLLTGRLRRFLSWRLLAGTGVAAAVALPWHVAVARANPDFLGYYVIREHLMRFTGQRYPSDEFVPLSIFLILTLLWTFPWLPFLPQALTRGIKRLAAGFPRQSEDLLPFLWLTVIIGLFAASRSRLEYYSLPAVPGFALLIGKLWDDAMNRDAVSSPLGGIVTALWAMACVMVSAAAAALIVLGPWKDWVSQTITAAWPTGGWVGSPDQMATLDRIRIPAMAAFAGAALVTAGALAAAKRARPGLACSLMAGMMVPFFALVHWGFLAVEPYESTRPVAEIVQRAAGPDDVVVFPEPHEYMWVGGITFYTKRPIHILKDPKFDGLSTRRREPADRFLDQEGLLALWGSDRHVIVVGDAEGKLAAVLSEVRPVQVIGRSSDRQILSNGRASYQREEK